MIPLTDASLSTELLTGLKYSSRITWLAWEVRLEPLKSPAIAAISAATPSAATAPAPNPMMKPRRRCACGGPLPPAEPTVRGTPGPNTGEAAHGAAPAQFGDDNPRADPSAAPRHT